MDQQTKAKLLVELTGIEQLSVSENLNWPEAYCKDTSKIRAIVLGCDPSNQHDQNLKYAFGIETETPLLKQFFAGVQKNLAVVGLSLEDVYAQNFCQNYFEKETSKNPGWSQAAAVWIPYLKVELDSLPIRKTVPVFLTASILYEALTVAGKKRYSPHELYSTPTLLPVDASDNYLERPLFPLFRGDMGRYDLGQQKWRQYVNVIKAYLRNHPQA